MSAKMFSNLKLINIFLVGVFICSMSNSLYAQNKISEKTKKDTPTTCEYIKNALDYSLIEAAKFEGSHIIFVFRLGKGETSKTLNQSRMDLIRKYLNFRNPNFNQIVFKQGEKSIRLGKIEIYVGKKLAWEISLKKNKSGWDSCIE